MPIITNGLCLTNDVKFLKMKTFLRNSKTSHLYVDLTVFMHRKDRTSYDGTARIYMSIRIIMATQITKSYLLMLPVYLYICFGLYRTRRQNDHRINALLSSEP